MPMKHLFKFILIPWLIIALPHPAGAQIFTAPKDKTATRTEEKPAETKKVEKPAPEPVPRKTPEKPPKEESIDVSADQIEQDSTKDMIIARHKVVVRYKTQMVRADYVRINMTTGAGEAIGHVFIQDDEGTRLKAERGTFNLKSEKAKLFNTQGEVAKKYIVTGEEFEKVGDDHYKVSKSTLTTCTGALPDWLLQVDSMDLKTGDRAYFKGGTFKVRDVPILYIPVGYLPLDNTRKSGFLMPSFGNSSRDGFTFNNSYYWAISEQSDATAYLDYLKKRGVRPALEYRYTPDKTTQGEFHGSMLQDDLTGHTFWKVDMTHKQTLPNNISIDGKLDLVDNNNFDKTFVDSPLERTRRNTDSFLQANKNWSNSSLDFLTRYRKSNEPGRDDKFALLPQITHKLQRTQIGQSIFYFNQDASYTFTDTDLNPLKTADQNVSIHRFDIHPQVSVPFQISWMSLTPTVGARETYYSKGFASDNSGLSGFSRKSFDINTVLEGPKFNKVYHLNSDVYPKLNHLIEPRFTYQYIPDIDAAERNKIKPLDAVDFINPANRISYSLMQRVLRKKVVSENEATTSDILQFEVSQTYDIREAGLAKPEGVSARPLSDVRFRLNSRLMEPLLLNFDTTYNAYDDALNTINFEVGVKPTNKLTMFLERRYTRNFSTFITGTIDWSIADGMRLQYSSRFDELAKEFRENDISVLYDDPCKCWGLNFDFIKRRISDINGINQDETRFMFGITLRGLGNLGTQKGQKPIHRTF